MRNGCYGVVGCGTFVVVSEFLQVLVITLLLRQVRLRLCTEYEFESRQRLL